MATASAPTPVERVAQFAQSLPHSGSSPSLRFEDQELETRLRPVLNIVLVGDGAVGKSALCEAMVRGTTPGSGYHQTIGLYIHETRLYTPIKHHTVELRLWDVGGHTLHSKLATNYLFYADAILFVYDITHVGSFASLARWLKRVYATFDVDDPVRANVRDHRLPYMALMANKTDLDHMRTVEQDRHEAFAKSGGFQADMYLSAYGLDDVTQCFVRICSELVGVRLSARPDNQPQASRVSTRKTTKRYLKLPKEEETMQGEETEEKSWCLVL
ncbi:P-loop containing nucleoside triphosphate hydrolase protein [Entophlyctis helioformis]|nr:P-loop containing nucleoside triphosphate hydrolase protein [Entophlyctis helioformis]